MRLPGMGIDELTAALSRVAAGTAEFAGAAGAAGMLTRGTPVRMNPDARWCVVSWLSYRARQKRCSFRLDCCRRSSARGSARFCRNLSGEFCEHIQEYDRYGDPSTQWQAEVRLRHFAMPTGGSSRSCDARVDIAQAAQLTAGWQDARAARHSFRHSSARVSLAFSAARRSAAAASSRSRACSTLMLACAALAASAVRRASRSCAAVLSLSCGARLTVFTSRSM